MTVLFELNKCGRCGKQLPFDDFDGICYTCELRMESMKTFEVIFSATITVEVDEGLSKDDEEQAIHDAVSAECSRASMVEVEEKMEVE